MTCALKYRVVAVADTIEDRVIQQSLEVTAFAEEICGSDPSQILLVVTGRNIQEQCKVLSEQYNIDVEGIEHDDFYYPNPDLLASVLRDIFNDYNPEILCMSHTIRNSSSAASVAAELKIQCITAVESFTGNGEQVYFQRGFFNGKLKEIIEASGPARIITVIPGAFQVKDKEINTPGNHVIRMRKTITGHEGCIPVSLVKEKETESGLEEADVIIAAGRGILKQENLDLVRETAGLFDNAAVGASRPVCDNRWLPYRHQVGVTGKTVSPKLYMALGISGSQQHISGMKNSQCIVAVNKDPDAAIYSVSDYIIVEDLTKFLPVFIMRCREILDK